MRFPHCPRCGAATERRPVGDEGPVDFCPACDTAHFETARPGVIVLVHDGEGRVVLLRQDRVSTTHSVLVAGWIRSGETAEETARREVAEETGLAVESLAYAGSWYHESSDGLLLGFVARARGELSRDSAEVDDLEWVSASEAGARLRPGSIAAGLFDRAREVFRSR